MNTPDSDRYRNLWSDEERRRLAPILARFSSGLAGIQGAVEQTADKLARFTAACRSARAAWAAENDPPSPPADASTVAAWLAGTYSPKVRLARRPTHGRVLLATAPIEAAEVVMVEPPLLVASSPRVPTAEEEALGWLASRWRLMRGLEGRGAAPLALARDLHNAHEAAMPRFAAQVQAARAAGLRGLDELSDREVAELLGIAASNAHTRSRSSDGRETALQPALSMMSHSCAPNTTRFFDDSLALVHARLPIAEGEELTAAYVPQDQPVGERLVHLAYVYGFVCDCSRCRSATLAELEADLRRVRESPAGDGAEPSPEGAAARRAAVCAVVEAIQAREGAGPAG